jgi:hypothetical protein
MVSWLAEQGFDMTGSYSEMESEVSDLLNHTSQGDSCTHRTLGSAPLPWVNRTPMTCDKLLPT